MKVIALLVVITLALPCRAQHLADTFQNAEKQGYSIAVLDKQYGNALHADSTKAVFKGARSQRFIGAYTTMLNDLAAFLNSKGFNWDKPTRIFNRIYFEPNGQISYYLVNLENTTLNEDKKQQFLALLKLFVANYQIKITDKQRFAQCSPVVYQNSK